MKKKDRTDDAHDFSGMPAAKAVTPADVQAKEFGVSRFGGYKMRDVDEFLDELTASMTRLSEENERLRSGAILPAAPAGDQDLADTARQADEVIERARAEAARIVQDAKDRTATTTGLMEGGSDRPAVSSFLAREREFLQSLATLVQGHAEDIKAMARAARPTESAAPASARTGTGAATAAAPAAPAPAAPAPGRPPAATRAPETEEADDGADPGGDDEVAAKEEPIRVEEPEPATVARSEGDEEQEGSEGERDRSLRELFWGEE